MISFTFDIDWAPDWMIADIVEKFIEYRIKGTYFITHKSPVLEFLRSYSRLLELGIHPNSLPGSSHGNTVDEVMKNCLKIVPDVVSMRTHGLFQTSNFLIKAYSYGIIKDLSLFIPNLRKLEPFILYYQKCRLKRILYNWEDDFAIFQTEISSFRKFQNFRKTGDCK